MRLEEITPAEYRQHLVAEASTSVSFANILLAIGIASVGYALNQAKPLDFLIPIIYASLLIFASFFASIFYANVTGSARHYDTNSVIKPMIYGNSITEYLGVYLVVFTFPLIVWSSSHEEILTISAAVICYTMFALYQFSECDLLSRSFTSRKARLLINFILFAFFVATILSEIMFGIYERLAICCTFITGLVYLATHDIIIMTHKSQQMLPSDDSNNKT